MRKPYQRPQPKKEADASIPRSQPVLVKVCEFLNSLLAVDQQAITDLWKQRVRCNLSMANHPTVQVRQETESDCSVSFLGILNGLSWDSYVAIAAVYNPDTDLIENFTIMRTDGSPV